MCTNVHKCAQVCTSVHTYAQFISKYVYVQKYTQIWMNVHTYLCTPTLRMYKCTNVHKCAQSVQTLMHTMHTIIYIYIYTFKCAQACTSVHTYAHLCTMYR